ncbi:helix-turn-helix transcriptional regulator [Microlunatus flavus]|uniref:Helix-turn-helix domain-containing protein n=1 Tax=Microlunatus flavus TaxID=1036181 RepID=A0A1H9IHW4_9ACTN|nr:helix-turn-helix transcriptional regulator [Microlunatus flavus]SEQ73965.1 Helix-turn-helix domain-containing protein [Microlunatus flavus]
MTTPPDRGDLAGLIRAWRDRLAPAAVGFPVGQRRTPGLRREEVALLAGLSVDYLVRLEQGRAERPSAQVVASLARVLQLSDPERDQLYAAAGLAAPSAGLVPTHIPGSVQRLLARLPDVAIGVYTATWTLLTANDAWSALLGPIDPGRNLVLLQFTRSGVRVLRGEADERRFECALVSDLRRAAIRYPDDPGVTGLVEELHRVSPVFASLWAEARIVEHRSEPKTFVHPVVGPITLDCDVFTAAGTDLRIVAYTAVPGSADASRFDLLRTVGAEQAPGWPGADLPACEPVDQAALPAHAQERIEG